jgi:hypothetical protein
MGKMKELWQEIKDQEEEDFLISCEKEYQQDIELQKLNELKSNE